MFLHAAPNNINLTTSSLNLFLAVFIHQSSVDIICNPFHVWFSLCGGVLRPDSKLFQKTAEEGRLEGATIHHPGSQSDGPCRVQQQTPVHSTVGLRCVCENVYC